MNLVCNLYYDKARYVSLFPFCAFQVNDFCIKCVAPFWNFILKQQATCLYVSQIWLTYHYDILHWAGFVDSLIEVVCRIYALITYAIIGSDNGLSLIRRRTYILSNAELLSIGPLGTNFRENFIEMNTLSIKKIHLKISSVKWWPFCFGLHVSRCKLWANIFL